VNKAKEPGKKVKVKSIDGGCPVPWFLKNMQHD